MTTQFYAHRGSSKKFAENTRAAYLQALRDGADGIECDVHLSNDGIVICHHDQTVNRTSESEGNVVDYTFEELKTFDFTALSFSQIPEEFGTTHTQLVSLSELLTLLGWHGKPIGLAIELKHPSPVGRLLDDQVLKVLADHYFDARTGRAGIHGNIQVSLMSFDADCIEYLAQSVHPDVLCQLIVEVSPTKVQELLDSSQALTAGEYRVEERSMTQGVQVINQGKANIIGPGITWVRANEHLVTRWLEQGKTARIWTVDHPADAQYLIDLGVQQLTTNRPAELRKELEYNES